MPRPYRRLAVNVAEAVYHHFYCRRRREAELRRTRFSDVRIVSVGNLTVGGTGKTPAVQWLARRLQKENLKVVVVGRGYGGESSVAGAIVSDGKTVFLDARQAGDEAILHARALPGVAVVIGRDRVAAVQTALEKFAPQIVVLDDGFQYWSLARDFDLVLLDARAPFGNGKLLPSGRLREPQSELKRAAGVLLTRVDAASRDELQSTRAQIAALTNAPVFQAAHAPIGLRDEASGADLETRVLAARPVAALAALADNAAFFQTLQNEGAQLVSTLARRDHHRWQEREVRDFVSQVVARKGAQAVLTTEKDAVKIVPAWCAPLPLWSLKIALQIEDENALWNVIRHRM